MVSEALANDNFSPEETEWDNLDVEKSEDQLEYEKNEEYLRDSIFKANDARNEELLERNKEIHQIFTDNNHEQAEEVEETMQKIIGGLHGSEQASLEALFEYVDSKYPSPFIEKEEPEDTFRAEDDYRRAMMREGEANNENLEKLAKIFNADGSAKDLHIAQLLRLLGRTTADDRTKFSSVIVDYLKNPTPENREKMTRLQSNHEGALSNSLFNIAVTFDESETAVGEKMLNPTVLMATGVLKGSEEIYSGIMKYLRFKIDNSEK